MSESSSAPAAPTVEQLLVLLVERDRLIESLVARVGELEARLGKNSQNSSKPPSTDNPFEKPPPRSLRGKSGRRPGKQPGQGGARLEPRIEPDEVVVHIPGCCQGCGGDLTGAPVVDEQAREVFDLPPMRLQVTEHQAQSRTCGCGGVSTASFPTQASAPTCYGPGVAALAVYLMGRQHLPVARTAELMSDVLGAPVSTGWLSSLLPAAAGRLAGFLAATQDALRSAPVAHFDETGGRVAGRLWWVHVACTGEATLYHRASGRGKDSMNLGGVLPGFTGIGIHDGLTSYRGYEMGHGLCNAHHLRELAGIAEATGALWPTEMSGLLVEINTAVKTAKANTKTSLSARRLASFRARYRTIIAHGWAAHPPPPPTGKQGRPKLGPAGSLVRRLDIYQDDVLRFATDFTVAFDNNQAERDIRMIRLQQKISGGWRTETGADAFLSVRSYLSTARKHHRNALDVLTELFTGSPWIPATT